MEDKLERAALRLNAKALRIAAIEHNLRTDKQIAEAIGVSSTQLWKATLPINDPRHNTPGPAFIAGVLSAFGEPFERFFFLEEKLTRS
ncbi:hypothetical protein AS888_20770 [Peribacillus simplex]|uniref:XRE family transcriptional regulator n=1 Tax=Peribacillus simplex TaxID=1478 RepID=A0A120GPD4_9BACI|nr:hypothetical protein [Peribacillus simplex]KWW17947.1 hypothetical protein AS888_20770 [Peribacillus simplex]